MKHKGYILPDDHQPEGYYTLCVRVPRDVAYLRAFFGALDFFGKWLAWDDGGDGRAAEAAAVWKVANELTRAAYAAGECGDMPAFRINDDTCLLEVNCGTDESPDWQPVHTDGGYDPSTNAPTVINYPDPPPAGEENECLAAENVTAWLMDGTEQFVTLLDGTGAIGDIIAWMYGILSYLLNVVQSNLFLTVQTNFGLFNASTIVADLAAFDWDEVKCLLYENYSSDGTITPAAHNVVLNEMLDRIPTNQIWRVLFMVWTLMGSVGASNASAIHGITDGDCVCGLWHQVWDFTIDQQGWSGYTGDTTYVAGQGWQSSIRDMQIFIAGPTRTVRYQKIVFDVPSEPTTRVVWLNYDTSNGYDQTGVGGVLEWMSGDLANMTFYGGLFTGGQVAMGHSWAGVKVVRVEEWGEGANPWL